MTVVIVRAPSEFTQRDLHEILLIDRGVRSSFISYVTQL
jgi:hypothetical protein